MTHVSDQYRSGKLFPTNGQLPGAPLSIIYAYNIVPATLDADGIAVAQAVGAAGNLTLNGALASGGTVTMDVPRAVSVTSSDAGDTTQTATVSGYDVYGAAMSEVIAFNGAATISGKKAFYRVTQIAISAALAGNGSAGTLDIFGMPYAIGDINYYLAVKWASALADDASTVLAAVTTTATTTTGDVRGTVVPSSAANGSRRMTAYLLITNPDTQAGLYGVTQA